MNENKKLKIGRQNIVVHAIQSRIFFFSWNKNLVIEICLG